MVLSTQFAINAVLVGVSIFATYIFMHWDSIKAKFSGVSE